MTLEQLVRNILSQAISDGLVLPADKPPEVMTAGDLVGAAEILNLLLQDYIKHSPTILFLR